MIVGLEAERRVMKNVYGLPAPKVAVIPLGLTDAFLKAGRPTRTADHLICTGRIDPVKNSLALAKLARQTHVPIQFVGKPHDERSDYWMEFQSLIDNKLVKHQPHVSTEPEMVELLRSARGYVLMSRFENWSLAAHEAAACGLPVLLPDQPWSRERFGGEASYWPHGGFGSLAGALREFYERCPGFGPPRIKFYSWLEVAVILKKVYEELLSE
jgi:glycosyltransferase involved in cell wall biosynthesis